MKKTCLVCKIEKEITEFWRNPNYEDGYLRKCRLCMKADKKSKKSRYDATARWRKKNPDKNRVYQRNYFDSIHGRFKRYQYDAYRRNYSFSITLEQFKVLIEQDCFYCGQEKSMGVDRHQNNIGYQLENCVPCCQICNRMKNDFNGEDFLDHVRKILVHSGF